ncbi:S26 family signal peptidase [Leisingera sp. ANG-Vp]|uniref:S26 family signal peptidase n=1 Tax=Leisingera sp. ANG-Vp TaxID=1577896 RepID=UPI00068CB670|nr:S26 family signal peptidase [Leisingera sp. ANG-Vp]
MRRSKLLLILPAIVVAAAGYYTLACGRLVVNATSSLKGNAYAMVTWPLILRPGAIVAVEMPEVLKGKLSGHELYLTKRIAGVAGDPVQRLGNSICINDTCVEGQLKDGAPVAPLWDGEVVPEGTIAVFGDSPDSLDSRYAVIGPRPVAEVVAAGFEIPFPHWTEIAERRK